MTEATGAGVKKRSKSWQKFLQQAGWTDVATVPGEGLYIRQDFIPNGVWVDADHIDWLIDTLVLAKAQVQGE